MQQIEQLGSNFCGSLVADSMTGGRLLWGKGEEENRPLKRQDKGTAKKGDKWESLTDM